MMALLSFSGCSPPAIRSKRPSADISAIQRKRQTGGTTMAGYGETLSLTKEDMEKLKEKAGTGHERASQIQRAEGPGADHGHWRRSRVELLESAKGTFFESGSSNPSEIGKAILVGLAKEMGKMPNNIVIEGHTDSKPFSNRGTYTNWELSADRANQPGALWRITAYEWTRSQQVRGFADQQLRKPDDPNNASNRRISVIVQYLKPADGTKEIAKTREKFALAQQSSN